MAKKTAKKKPINIENIKRSKGQTIRQEWIDLIEVFALSKPILYYIRDSANCPYGVLTAFDVGNVVAIGYSFCHWRDSFSKDLGKLIAIGRALCYLSSTAVWITNGTDKNHKAQRKLYGKPMCDRIAKVPNIHFEIINDFINRCRDRFENCTFPLWTDILNEEKDKIKEENCKKSKLSQKDD